MEEKKITVMNCWLGTKIKGFKGLKDYDEKKIHFASS